MYPKLKFRFIYNNNNDNSNEINRGIFQGDALSLLQSVIATMSLNHIRRKCTERIKFTKSRKKINPLMYLHDIKLFAKNE